MNPLLTTNEKLQICTDGCVFPYFFWGLEEKLNTKFHVWQFQLNCWMNKIHYLNFRH